MSHTLYLVYSGLQSRADALEVLSHNLSNVQSTGFKRSRFAFEVRDQLTDPEASPVAHATNGPVVRASTRQDFSIGSLAETGGPLDLALAGDGFFAVQTAAGVRYTRNGHFQVDAEGRMTDGTGRPVLSADSPPRPLVLPTGEIRISTAGQISVDGIPVGDLRVVSFSDPARLRAVGEGLFEAPEGLVETPPMQVEVLQGYLEESNVNPIDHVMEMVSLMRHFELLAQAARSLSRDVDDRLVNELAKV
ncbi:MAG TPA: flagellar hook basal-body protein [Acidobacteriota bacterium]|nr:flagellar hook basal-body protein [Acidobacteriota bacterium]HRR56873.1 flagellar hook basal-body protein [Acidobacteriota bacterium]HRV07934.1 flagellar hook basal-body protein [Acidobacteriota bacterium]